MEVNGFWKWVAGGCVALIISNFATAMAFRTSPETIGKVVRDTFTDTSREKGMYAIEGRPRLDRLEARFGAIEADLAVIRNSTASIEAQLKFLNKDVPQ